MKILVTGSSGFISQHLIPLLQKEGHYVIGVDKRPELHRANRFLQTDVGDLNFRDLMGVNAVIHLAFATNIPNSIRHPKETTEQNIDMTIHLLEVCKDAEVGRFVFPSTASLYGSNKTPWTEDMPSMPIEPYSWQKLALEYACGLYTTQYKLPTVVLRFFQVFGEYQRDDTALAAFIRAKQSGKPITLTQTTAQSSFKSGRRDFVYAGDVAEAILKAATVSTVGNGEIINIAGGKATEMREVAEAMKAKIKWIERRPWEVETHLADIKKARVLLGWEAKTDVLEWVKQYAK